MTNEEITGLVKEAYIEGFRQQGRDEDQLYFWKMSTAKQQLDNYQEAESQPVTREWLEQWEWLDHEKEKANYGYYDPMEGEYFFYASGNLYYISTPHQYQPECNLWNTWDINKINPTIGQLKAFCFAIGWELKKKGE